MKPPAEYYYRSNRKWDGQLRSIEYDRRIYEVRKVEKSGQISYRGRHQYISETLYGEYVGLKEIDNDKYEIFFGPIYLGILDKEEFKKPKMQRRRQK